jgi:hypothetical protein
VVAPAVVTGTPGGVGPATLVVPLTAVAASPGAAMAPASLPHSAGAGAGDGLALALESALQASGAEALPRARRLSQSARQPLDRCALDLFIAVGGKLGEAEAARWAVHLAGRARAESDEEFMPSLITLALRIEQQIRGAVGQGEAALSEALGIEPDRLHLAIAAARDARGRCPAAAARRILELTAEEGEEGQA